MSRAFSTEKAVVKERQRIISEFIAPLKQFLDTRPTVSVGDNFIVLTRSSVSTELGLQRNALYKFMSGKQTPTVDTLARVSLFLKKHGVQRGCV